MAKKDFWFPLHFEKFLNSTNGWEDEQVGAYLRLLIYQFQNGYIPSDMKKISRISFSAKKHWKLLSTKFTEGKGGFYNEVMDEIRITRMNQIDTATENGKKGGRPKQNNNQTETQPLSQNLSRIDNNINIDINTKNIREGIAWEMIEVFTSRFPHYPVDPEKDPMAVMQIANKISDKKGFQKHQIVVEKRSEIVNEWKRLADFAASDKWFSTRSISDLNKEWQRLIQSFVPVITVLPEKNKMSAREEEDRKIIGL